MAPFSGLCHFPQGQGFKQWTGDDSKALMKVFLPTRVLFQLTWFNVCALVQCDFHDTKSLEATQEALDKFHHYHDIFKDVGIHEDFNLP